MKKHIRNLVIVLALAIPLLAIADNQLIGLGVTYWGVVQTFDATDATCVTDPSIDTTPDNPNNGGRVSGCALFPAASGNRFHVARATVFIPETNGRCYWTGDTAVELDAAGVLAADTNAENDNTVGSMIRMSAGGAAHHQKASREVMRTQAVAGARDGLCPNAVRSGGDLLYAPCSCVPVGGYCTGTCPAAHGGGTCDDTPSSAQVSMAGMIANCEGGAIHIRKEVVPDWQN